MNPKRALSLFLLALPLATVVAQDEGAEIEFDADSFACITQMSAVRHFYVSNLLGDIEATLAVANSSTGGVYPPGSVVQLVPTEVMVKHRPGWNDDTHDWEFVELDVSAEGSTIRNRGFTDVINRFGGNCFECHRAAKPEWDMICEKDHGCLPVPLTSEMILDLQQNDPRCSAPEG